MTQAPPPHEGLFDSRLTSWYAEPTKVAVRSCEGVHGVPIADGPLLELELLVEPELVDPGPELVDPEPVDPDPELVVPVVPLDDPVLLLLLDGPPSAVESDAPLPEDEQLAPTISAPPAASAIHNTRRRMKTP